MAEAIARHLGGPSVEAYSAGLAASGAVDDKVVAALNELGYSAAGLSSKGLGEVPLTEMDVVVSLIGEPGLAVLPPNLGAQRQAWSIRDPLGEDEETFLAAARLIERRVKALLADLEAGGELR